MKPADQLCGATGNARTATGSASSRPASARSRCASPSSGAAASSEDVIERYQRVDRAVAATVAEMYATGTSTRKVAKVAAKMGLSACRRTRSAIAQSLDAEADELPGPRPARHEDALPRLDATASRQVGGARRLHRRSDRIGCDDGGWRHVVGFWMRAGHRVLRLVDGLPESLRERGICGVELVVSDAHEGLKRASQRRSRAPPGSGRRAPDAQLHPRGGRGRSPGRRQDNRARVQGKGRRRRPSHVPRRHRHARGLLPEGGGDHGGGRAGRAGVPDFRGPTGSACVPTTCRSAPTAR